MTHKNLLYSFLFVFCFLKTISSTQAQTLLAGWDFQTTTNGGTAVAASPNTPTSYTSNVGTGTLSLDGVNGSSTWAQATELNAFGGTALNAGGATGLSTVTTSPACLALLGGTTNSANGKSLVFSFSMTNFVNLVVSYATQKTNTGFSSQAWEYSTDGMNWTAAQTLSTIPTSFAVQTLTTITALDNAATAYLRLTVTGATNATGNNRLDNFQLNATSTLPITLTGFNAAIKNNASFLSFSTASERNNSHFEIERSTDGQYYTNIGRVAGAINADSEQHYTFTDETPVKGINYYRLKQVDLDGQFSYSPVRSVVFGKTGNVVLYPAPTAETLNVQLEEALTVDAQWQIVDLAGRVVGTGILAGEQAAFQLPVGTLSEGAYILQITADQVVMTKQFRKQ